jgi:carboxyl-terminal processing protease
VEVPSIEHPRILDPPSGTAYFKLAAFQKTTALDLDRALWQLHRSGMKSLIIDLRGNPGGLLTASVEAADRFLEAGTIVSTKGRNPQEDFTYTAQRPGTWNLPLVVLIDGESASASEIFAGAMRDHNRATIIGERSYGKGSVQGIFPVNIGGTGIRLTTAKFYSPRGQGYSKVGVEPHLEVHNTANVPFDDSQQNLEQLAGERAWGQSVQLAKPILASPAANPTTTGPEVRAAAEQLNEKLASDPVITAALRVTRQNVAAR